MLGYAVLLSHTVVLCSASRTVRYVEFNPPQVLPQQEHVTVQARQNYTLSCEGHRPLTWNLPMDATNKDVTDRVTITHITDAQSDGERYIAHLQIRHLVYTDTGSYVCSFNDSHDHSAIDTSTPIYVFVFDEIHLMTQEGFDFQQSVAYKTAEIPCKPTHPNISVSLTLQGKGPVEVDNTFIKFNPKVGFMISPVLPEHSGQYWCYAKYGRKTSEYGVSLRVLMKTKYVPPPHINRTSGSHVTVGETLVLTCSISVNWNVMVRLSWNLPNRAARQPRLLLPDPISRNVSIGGTHLKVVEQKLQLNNVDKEDQGSYACIVTDHSNNQQTRREFVRIYERNQSFLRVWQDGYSTLHKSSGKDDSVQWVVEIASHPPPRVTWYDPDGNIINEGEDKEKGRLVQTVFAKTSRSMLKLMHLKLEDSGDYGIKVENDFHEKWENFTLIVTDKPKIEATVQEPSDNGLYQYGSHYTLKCTATGYPAPEITWTFKRCKSYGNCNGKIHHLKSTVETKGRVESESKLMVIGSESGVYTCMGCNGNCEMSQVKFFVTTLPEGFHIEGPTQAIEGDSVELLCAASKYNYTDNSLVWYKQIGKEYKEVTTLGNGEVSFKNQKLAKKYRFPPTIQVIDDIPSKFDVGKRMRFESVKPQDSGVYACRARIQGPTKRHNLPYDETIVERQMELKVQRLEIPEFVETLNMNTDTIYIKEDGETIEMKCKVKGNPIPKVFWYLNDTAINFVKDMNFQTFDDGQSLRIAAVVAKKNEGKYSCKASSRAGVAHLDQMIVKVIPPKIYKTDMFGSSQIIDTNFEQIVDAGTSINFTCKSSGNPKPVTTWLFNNQLINNARTELLDNRHTLIIKDVGRQDEGRYECVASNIGGSVTRYQLVKLRETQQHASIYASGYAIPIYIAVGVALVIALILLVIVKCCCKRNWKAPPTPPTPRLTQYDQPEEGHETESCRLTLSRDASPFSPVGCRGCNGCSGNCHQCSGCHYNFNGLYGCSGGTDNGIAGPIMGSGLIGVRSCYTPPSSYPPSISGVNYAASIPSSYATSNPSSSYAPSIPSPMSDFTNYSTYSQATLPHRMETLNREMTMRFQERRNISPPLTAEF